MVGKKIKACIYMIGMAATMFIGTHAYAAGITDGQVVDAKKTWKVTFSQNVVLDDLTKQGIVVQDNSGNNIAVGVEAGTDNKSILISPPKDGYKSGGNYTLILNDKIHSDRNVKLKETKTMHFSIQKAVEANTSLHIIYSGSKMGLIDSNGKVVVQPTCDYISTSPNETYATTSYDNNPIIVEINYKYGLMDKTGKFILEPKYDYIYNYSDGLARALIGNKTEFIDCNGKVALEYDGSDVGDFHSGFASIKNDNNKYGFIDKTGKVVIQPQFDNYIDYGSGENGQPEDFIFSYEFNGNYAAVVKDGKFGVIDKLGNYKIKPDSNFKMFASDNLILVGQGNNGYKYIDINGNTVFTNSNMNFKAVRAHNLTFHNGFALFIKDGADGLDKVGVIDEKGKIIKEAQFNYTRPEYSFSDGMILLMLYGEYNKFECLNPITGNEICVDGLQNFNDGLALVSNDSRDSYYIDKNGRKVLQLDSSFGWLSDFEDGLAYAIHDGKQAYIDKTGKVVWQEK